MITTLIIYTIGNIIYALIKSIGLHWNEELRNVWINQCKWWINKIWIPVLINIIADVIVIIITLIFTGTIINIVM